jgi:hypothetical protein
MKFGMNIFAFLFFALTIGVLIDSVSSNSGDGRYKDVQKAIFKYAKQMAKSPNMDLKRKFNGALQVGYPEDMRERAFKMRNDKKKWNKILAIPTELYRFCVHPFAKVNYEKWCENSFIGAASKLTSKIIS